LAALALFGIGGCTEITGYSDASLYREDVSSICLEMFDNQSFRRGVEYELSDALAKRIEADTPYKVVSDADRADTVMSGRIVRIDEAALSLERELGYALEKEVRIKAVVSWKNLQTGEMLIDNESATGSGSYSEFQQQDFGYASVVAANKLAQEIVELMEKSW
jgi:hypothetical protein